MPNIKKNVLQSGESLYINSWRSGLYTQRNPLYTPVSTLGIQLVQRHDALIDGLNMELSNNFTLIRRFGFSKFCSTAFGANDYPLNFYSFANLSGTINLLVDTPTMVAQFTTTAITSLFTKGTTQQSNFQKVGNVVYWCDGTSAKKWTGSAVSNWGIAFPLTAPTLSFGAGVLSPTSGYQYVYVYKNSSTGHISTASPVSANTGALTSQNITVQGTSSSDPQVDKVDIYRTLDGGSIFYFVGEVANGGTWSFTDNNPDSSLNTALVAPVADANDPPPANISLVTYHMGRMWVAVNNLVYFGGGPDTTNGVAEECFPPANVFKFPGLITALASTTNGLVVFTASDAYVILGTDTVSFWSRLWQRNFGVQTQNCVAQDGDTLFVYTAKSQLFLMQDQLSEIGFTIGDKLLANFNPANSYLKLHRSGTDAGLFISNGVDSIFRYSLNFSAWCPVAQPVNGVRAIASLETSTANYALLMGRTAGNGFMLKRDLTTFQDDTQNYDAYATVGSLVVSPPGETSRLEAVMLEVMPVGTYPSVSVLVNDISGTFVGLPNPVNDPPLYDSTLAASTGVVTKRHYLKAAAQPVPQLARHLQVKVDFGSQNAKSELLGLAVQ